MASGSSSERPNASARSWWTCAVAAPSRSASPAKSPPASAARASFGRVQVAHAGRGQRPAVRGRAEVPGQDGEHRGRAVHPGLDPAVGLGDVRRAQLGQGRGHLQVRVRSRGDPAEHLEDGRLAEHQAGVALLAGEHQAVQTGFVPRTPRIPKNLGPGDPAEPQHADGPVIDDRVEQRPGQRRVVQAVIDLQALVRADPRVPQPGREPRARADEQLVAIRGRAVRDGDEQVPQARVAGMISVSATTARSWTVRPLPANHRCLTSHVASVSSKVMSAYHIPLAGPGKHAPADLRAA